MKVSLMKESLRTRIVTAPTRLKLDLLVNELLRKGWQKVGDVVWAKSVVDWEPPYLCQSMSRNEKPAEEPSAEAASPSDASPRE